MNTVKVIVGLLTALFVVFVLAAIESHGYDNGYSQAAIEYETKLSEQKSQFIDEQAMLEEKLNLVTEQAAKKTHEVQQVFVPVEKEIVKYVSRKPSPDDKCGVNVSRWMQLHNAAANPYDVQSRTKLDDASVHGAGAN